MKRMLTLVAYLLPGWALSAAHAAPPVGESAGAVSEPEGSISIAALLGYGFGGDLGRGDDNVFGVGYGLAAGYVFPSNVYLGSTLLRYKGPANEEYQIDTFTLDVELGYEFGAGSFALRPSLGLGALAVIFQGESGGNSALRPQLVPSLLAQYSLGIVRVGAEARYALVMSYPDVLSLLGSVGVAF